MAEEIEIGKYDLKLSSTVGRCPQISPWKQEGGGFLAYLTFYPEGEQLGRPSKDQNNYFHFCYRVSAYPYLVDILRNEKPVYLYFNQRDARDPNTAYGSIATGGHEPVGEEET